MSLENYQTDELAALLAVAEAGSFVMAGIALNRHPTIISKRVSALEKRLGIRLLERTTRQVRLTDAGACLAERFRIATDAITEAAAGSAKVRGRLRLALPAAMGRQWLAPAMTDFARCYPALDIEVDYAERHVDLIGEGFDAALRLGTLSDSRLIARKLGEHRLAMGASPEFLARHGTPSSPRDLMTLNLLRYTGPVATPEWRLRKGNQREEILPQGRFRSNDIGALIEAARCGIGIAAFGEWSMARDFAKGSLVRLLADWSFEGDGGIHLLRPSTRFAPARTLAFVQWITALFTSGLPWER